jgi:periplasmic protein TonB
VLVTPTDASPATAAAASELPDVVIEAAMVEEPVVATVDDAMLEPTNPNERTEPLAAEAPRTVPDRQPLAPQFAMQPWRQPEIVAESPTPPAPPAPPPEPATARVLVPVAGTNLPPEYPPAARRRQQQGTVVIAFACDELGVVTEVVVQRSSGFPLLDAAAVAAVQLWRFTNGPGRSEQPFEFRLDAQ